MDKFFQLLICACFLFTLAGCGSRDTAGPSAEPTATITATAEPTAAAQTTAEPVKALSKYSTVFMDTFDTVISLIGYTDSQESFNEKAQEVHERYLHLHKLFDTYNSYEAEGITSIYTVNERAAEAPVQVDPILFDLLKFAKTYYQLTKGQTNIAMGSVLSIWHDYREAGISDPEHAVLPPMDALQNASGHIDIEKLILDDENMTVYFADPELKLDVGAVAKGYATEIVAQMLLASDMPSFIISAGGNVRTGIAPQDGRPNWGVGIQDPDGAVLNNNSIVETLYLRECSVVTSGDYQRYYTVDGKNYCHLIDPDTLMPGSYFRSVTIITEDSGYADLLSTAAYLMPYEESRAFIEGLDQVEAIWVFADGSIQMTDGIKPAAKSQGATNSAVN